MKTNLPWHRAWKQQLAFLLVCLIVKASCLYGFGLAPEVDGWPVCSKHRYLSRLFEAGKTLSIHRIPQNKSKQHALSMDQGLGQRSRLAVTNVEMRECLQQVNSGEISDSRSCYQPCRGEWGENSGGNTSRRTDRGIRDEVQVEAKWSEVCRWGGNGRTACMKRG